MNYTPEQEQKWLAAVSALKATMQPSAFDVFIKPLVLYAVTDEELLLTTVQTEQALPIIRHMIPRLNQYVTQQFGREYTIRVLDPGELIEMPRATSLNPKYTFENFVVGPSNNFAYAASMAVSEQPSDIYNPLFIYGDVGLGKTHLLNAIGNHILGNSPTAKVLLTTSERFTNELIELIRRKKTEELRSRMRSVDVLMVDDVQFLARTTVSQEEFFHTFNDLFNHGKQIILSSDRPPSELPTLEERLRSRFASGLLVDVRRPDYETRVAILRRKAEEDGVDLPSEAADYIASHFDRSIRELEGALNGVTARSRLLGYPITLQMTVDTLREMALGNAGGKLTPRAILGAVAQQYGIRPEDITSRRRSRDVVLPRQIAIYICRELTDLSTVSIGQEFGGRDHTTVMHSCDKIADLMNTDPAFKKQLSALIHDLQQ